MVLKEKSINRHSGGVKWGASDLAILGSNDHSFNSQDKGSSNDWINILVYRQEHILSSIVANTGLPSWASCHVLRPVWLGGFSEGDRTNCIWFYTVRRYFRFSIFFDFIPRARCTFFLFSSCMLMIACSKYIDGIRHQQIRRLRCDLTLIWRPPITFIKQASLLGMKNSIHLHSGLLRKKNSFWQQSLTVQMEYVQYVSLWALRNSTAKWPPPKQENWHSKQTSNIQVRKVRPEGL